MSSRTWHFPFGSYFPAPSLRIPYATQISGWFSRASSKQSSISPSQRPPNVTTLLSNRESSKTYAEDATPLGSLYRMYQYLVLDHNNGLRSEIEWFFNRAHWAVADIPDPVDPDPERYAVLAVLPQYLVMAFNRLIEKGLPRDAPAIIGGDDEWDELKSRTPKIEKLPSWCEAVPALPQLLEIPDKDGSLPNEETRSKWYFEKNILIHEPHVLFV